MKIKCNKIYTSKGIVDGVITIEGSKIVSIVSWQKDLAFDLDYSDYRIIPGIIDTHNHGTMGYSLIGNNTSHEKTLEGYLKGLASQGVTACLPTAHLSLFETIANYCDKTPIGAKPIGIHSEGPYLNRVGEKGVDQGHPEIDLEFVKEMIQKGKGKLKLVGLAPELERAQQAIDLLNQHGVRCAFAHSNMNYYEALECFNKGISVSTHTANVMSGIHHRNMGGLGACLLHDDVYNELICDGLHVSNEMIKIIIRTKKNPFDKIMMVSDNIALAGAPVGRYELEGFMTLNIDEKGYCLSDTGRLCGSTIPVIQGIRNLVENIGLPLEEVIKMASLTPALVYAVPQKGILEVGKDADFIIIDEEYAVHKTYVEGTLIYDKEVRISLFNPLLKVKTN